MTTPKKKQPHRFKKGNTYGRATGAHTLSVVLFKNNKQLLQTMIDKAIAGDMKALTWFLNKIYGRGPINLVRLSGKETAEEMLNYLKKNVNNLPAEILDSMGKLIDKQVAVTELTEIENRLDAIESGAPPKSKPKKKKKKAKKKTKVKQ